MSAQPAITNTTKKHTLSAPFTENNDSTEPNMIQRSLHSALLFFFFLFFYVPVAILRSICRGHICYIVYYNYFFLFPTNKVEISVQCRAINRDSCTCFYTKKEAESLKVEEALWSPSMKEDNSLLYCASLSGFSECCSQSVCFT